MESKRKLKYNLGLDLGIGSVGWGVVGLDEENNVTHIIDANVLLVDSLEDDKGNLAAAARRETRGARRLVRRRRHRIGRTKYLFKNKYNLILDDNFFNNTELDPYQVKSKGLKEKLTEEELAIALVHYVKHRGFKSNRKDVSESKEDGVLKESMNKMVAILAEKKMYPSEYLEDLLHNENKNVRNKDTYEIIFGRAVIEEEATVLLDKQLEFKIIDQDFKDKYLEICFSQRDFSEGPGGDSKYKVDFSAMFGKCNFEKNENRAAKCCPSNEFSTFLQKLHNLRYYLPNLENDEQLVEDEKSAKPKRKKRIKEKLDKEIIKKIHQKVLDYKYNITYKIIYDLIGIEDIVFDNVNLDRKEFSECVKKYREKHEFTKDEKIDFKDQKFIKIKNDKVLAKKFYEFKNFKKIISEIKNKKDENYFKEFTIEQLDDIVTGLTYYKTDIKLTEYFMKNGNVKYVSNFDFSEEDIELFRKLNTYSDSGSLSLKVLHKINPLMLAGYEYSEAMEKAGYDHSKINISIEKADRVPSIKKILELFPNDMTNPRVIRVIAKTIKIINAVIDEYGRPENINIEAARDMAHIRSKRFSIERDMLNNYGNNERIKYKIYKDFDFNSLSNVSKDDVVKYKLYEEQLGRCAYSDKNIVKDRLFTNDYEVDHIIPYSRCFDDSYKNKTLVKREENQQKGNKIPFEHFLKFSKERWNNFVKNIDNNIHISKGKKTRYFAKEIDEGWKQRSLNDTRFINKYICKVLTNTLNVNGEIKGYNAQAVSMMKKKWRIDRFTHSIDSLEYKNKKYYKFVDEVKFDRGLIEKSISLKMIPTTGNVQVGKEVTLTLKTKKEGKIPLTAEEKNLNKAIENFCVINSETINEIVKDSDDSLYGLLMRIGNNDISISKYNFSTEQKIYFICLINEFNTELNKVTIKKNRENHIHHVLDAVATACLNNRLLVRATKSYQREEIKKAKNNGSTEIFYDENGVVVEVDQFEKSKKDEFPLPYKNFVKEVKYRLYEQDIEKQKKLFEDEFAEDGKYRNIRPIFPVKEKIDRRNTRLHKDTIYGVDKNTGLVLKRVSIENINKKNVEKIFNKDKGAKHIYEAICNWLNSGKKEQYPTLNNDRPIKKVKMIESGDVSKMGELKDGKYVRFADVVCIDIYINNEGNYYFVQRNTFNIELEKKYKKNLNTEKIIGEPKLTVWWGQGIKHEILSTSEIKEKYDYQFRLYPQDLIEIELKKGQKSFAYVKGFTSGIFEIGSIIGDQLDLIENKLFTKYFSQCTITVSQIKNIAIYKLNILGEYDRLK